MHYILVHQHYLYYQLQFEIGVWYHKLTFCISISINFTSYEFQYWKTISTLVLVLKYIVHVHVHVLLSIHIMENTKPIILLIQQMT